MRQSNTSSSSSPSSSIGRIMIGLLLTTILAFIVHDVDASSTGINRLLDGTGRGKLQLESIPSTLSTSNGVVTIISSPGTPSTLAPVDPDDILSINPITKGTEAIQLLCKGSTLQGTTEFQRSAIAFCSLVSNSIIITGILAGDLDGSSSFRNSRHSRTLTTLFRTKIRITDAQLQKSDEESAEATTTLTTTTSPAPTTLLVLVSEADEETMALLKQEVVSLYQATAAEQEGSPVFEDLYDIQILSDETKALEIATQAAAEKAVQSPSALSSQSAIVAFSSAWSTVRDADLATSLFAGIDPPYVADAFVVVMNAHVKYTKMARNKIVLWKNRIARGLTIDSFGTEATALRTRCLNNGYDIETLTGSGLPQVAQYRLELRNQLQNLIDTAIEDCFNNQITNVQSSAIRKLQKRLLKTLPVDGSTYELNEAAITANAAILQQQTNAVESILESIQVPVLNLTKEKAIRIITSALNDALLAFPDSPVAKIKRSQQVQKVVSKETRNKKKKPGQRAFGIGIDLVAMIRPDGFGSLQGFAGYALPGGNSITVGIHNDADDPQVIAQFGGVRPPLLRVQPKLRIDVEL